MGSKKPCRVFLQNAPTLSAVMLTILGVLNCTYKIHMDKLTTLFNTLPTWRHQDVFVMMTSVELGTMYLSFLGRSFVSEKNGLVCSHRFEHEIIFSQEH